MNRIDIDLGIVAVVIALAALIYAVLATRKRALLSHIAAVEAALTREVAALRVKQDAVESRLARLPMLIRWEDGRRPAMASTVRSIA